MYFFKLLFLLPYDTCIISILSQGISKELDIFYELTIYRVYFFGRVPFEFVILLSILRKRTSTRYMYTEFTDRQCPLLALSGGAKCHRWKVRSTKVRGTPGSKTAKQKPRLVSSSTAKALGFCPAEVGTLTSITMLALVLWPFILEDWERTELWPASTGWHSFTDLLLWPSSTSPLIGPLEVCPLSAAL